MLFAGVFVCGGRAGAYMDGGRPQAGTQRRTGDTAFAGAADSAGRKRLLLSGRRGAAGQHPVLGGEAGGACLSSGGLSPLQLDAEPLEAGNTQRGTENPVAARACAGGRFFAARLAARARAAVLRHYAGAGVRVCAGAADQVHGGYPDRRQQPYRGAALSGKRAALLPPPPQPLAAFPHDGHGPLQAHQRPIRPLGGRCRTGAAGGHFKKGVRQL